MPENIQLRRLVALPDPLRTGAREAGATRPVGAAEPGAHESPEAGAAAARVEISRPGAAPERAAAEAVARREEAVAAGQARLVALEDLRDALVELDGAVREDRGVEEARAAVAEAGTRTFAGVRLIDPGETLGHLMAGGTVDAAMVGAALAEVESGAGGAREAVRAAAAALGGELVGAENAAAAAVQPREVDRAAEALRGRDARNRPVTVSFDPFQAAPLNRHHVLELLG